MSHILSNKPETENVVTRKVNIFLADKPIWVWWIIHIVMTGLLFGIFYLALYLLAIQRIIGVLILLATGMIWGSYKYFQIKGNKKAAGKKVHEPEEPVIPADE